MLFRSIVDKNIDIGYWKIFNIFDKMSDIIFANTNCRIYSFFCPHKPDSGCACRKPKPGMLYESAIQFDVMLEDSWMIGDQETDIYAGRAAGISNLIIVDETNPHMVDTIWKTSLLDAVKYGA